MSETMGKKWTFAEVIFVIAVVLVLLGVAAYSTAAAFSLINNKYSLPYSRPHIEFLSDDGTECAAWIRPDRGAYIVLCADTVPEIVNIHDMNEMRL